MVELSANGQQLDMAAKGSGVKYTRQIADIFDIPSVANSYTNSFNIPKTPSNTRIFEQLGIVGDVSTVPYSKVSAQLSEYGFPLIQQGWLRVKETSDSYKVSIIDGMIDFFKEIENKSMGLDLNLSEFDHEKNIETVVASFTNDFYKYIIADYNGKNEAMAGADTAINIDYLVPCFSVWKLLERVMETFNYTYDTERIAELEELYLTYPKAPSETIDSTLFAELTKGFFLRRMYDDGTGMGRAPLNTNNWATSSVVEGTLIDNWIYEVPESGVYRLEHIVETYVNYRVYGAPIAQPEFPYPAIYRVYINDVEAYQFQTDPFAPVTSIRSIYLSEGDRIRVAITSPMVLFVDNTFFELINVHHNSTNFKIYRTNQGSIILNEAFKNYKIKDFIKECFWFCAVTPILNNNTRHMSFVTLAERLDTTLADDWTDKFIRRTNETYDSGLAQKNIFRHQYTDPKDSYQDGYLLSDNLNQAEEQIIVQSKLYAPENITHEFFDATASESFTTKKFTIWSRETKEDADGEIAIEYKGLNERFYFMKLKTSSTSDWLLASETVIGSDTVDTVPYADTKGTTYSQIVPDRYFPYSGVLNNFRAHDIELRLGLMDFLQSDLTRPKYIGQEACYYVLNKLVYSEGKPSIGEFIKINRPVIAALPLEVNLLAIAFASLSIRIKIPILEGFDGFDDLDSYAIVNGDVTVPFSSVTSDTEFVTAYISIDPSDYEAEPIINELYFEMTDGASLREYRYISTGQVFTTGDIAAGTTHTLTATAQNI